MARLTDTSSRDEPVVRAAPILIGLALFVMFEAVLPVLWSQFVPVHVLPAGRWLWVIGALVAAAVVISRGDLSDRRGATFFTALLCMLVAVAIVAAPLFALQLILARVEHVDTQLFPSPHHRLVAVVESSDVGAWAPIQTGVYVRGRLLPGLLEWRYPLDTGEDFPDSVDWADNSTVVVNGTAQRVPTAIVWLAW